MKKINSKHVFSLLFYLCVAYIMNVMRISPLSLEEFVYVEVDVDKSAFSFDLDSIGVTCDITSVLFSGGGSEELET